MNLSITMQLLKTKDKEEKFDANHMSFMGCTSTDRTKSRSRIRTAFLLQLGKKE